MEFTLIFRRGLDSGAPGLAKLFFHFFDREADG